MTNGEVEIINQIKQGNLSTSYDLLTINRSFLCGEFKRLPTYGYTEDEFHSICYVALIKAAKAADLTKIDYFLGYWRSYIYGELLRERSRLDHYFSLTPESYKKAKLMKLIEEDNFNLYFGDSIACEFDDFEAIYKREIRLLLWKEINDTLTSENASIIYDIFVNNRKMCAIAKEMGIGAERVRRRKVRSLEKLKNNPRIQVLARDFYNFAT